MLSTFSDHWETCRQFVTALDYSGTEVVFDIEVDSDFISIFCIMVDEHVG